MDVAAGKGFYAPYGVGTKADNTEMLSWYVRGGWDGEISEDWDGAVITGKVSVADMHAWLKTHPDAFAASVQE